MVKEAVFTLAVMVFILACLTQSETSRDVLTLFRWLTATASGGFIAWVVINSLGNRNKSP